jgi:hypothetical protein
MQEPLRFDHDDPLVLSERQQVFVPRHDVVGAGGKRASNDFVIVGIANHLELRNINHNRCEFRKTFAKFHHRCIRISVTSADMIASEKTVNRLFNNLIGQAEFERSSFSKLEEIK